MSLVALIDRVVASAAARGDDLLAAREEWDARTGKVFDDDPLYEERSIAFLEWFALERVVPGTGRTPVQAVVAELPADDPDQDHLVMLSRTHRSLFVIRAIRGHHVDVDDLLTGCLFRVYERRQPLGLEEDDVFEARLCPRVEAAGEVVFTRGIQHHPREARSAIVALAERARGDGGAREETLFHLAKLRWKAARWGHVQPERIYDGTANGASGGDSDSGETSPASD